VRSARYSHDPSNGQRPDARADQDPAARSRRSWIDERGTAASDQAAGSAIDSAANVYFVGRSGGWFDGNESAGEEDVFITKYTPSGDRLWSRTLGTEFTERAASVAVDSEDSVYVMGTTEGNLNGLSNAGVRDVFISKFDAEGNSLWTRLLGTAAGETGGGLAIDAGDSIYVLGATGSEIDGNTSAGGSDIFLTRFDTDGVKMWTRQFGSSETDEAGGVVTDASGDIIVVGSIGGDFGGSNFGSNDIIVAKYDAEGTELWAHNLGTPEGERGEAVAVDAEGDILVVGGTSGFLDGNPNFGGPDFAVAKFSAEGDKIWTRQYGTNSIDLVAGIGIRSDGGFYLVGNTRGEFEGNTQAGLIDAFVTSYDKFGVQLWAEQFGTSKLDWISTAVVDDADNLYIGGSAGGSIFGKNYQGGNDLFVGRICPK